MRYITYKDFENLNLRIGTIKAVKQHPKLKDYILLIDLGTVEQDMQIVADLAESYTIEELIGTQVVYLENIKPITVEGIESQGLLLITHLEGKPVLLSPLTKVHTGVKIFGMRDAELSHHLKEEK